MKYYIHKVTGEPLATISNTMCELHSDLTAEGYPMLSKRDEKTCVFQLCVFPNRAVVNGVIFHAISYPTLQNFKRISKEKFEKICPDFGQYRHKNDKGYNQIDASHEIFSINNRKLGFGV